MTRKAVDIIGAGGLGVPAAWGIVRGLIASPNLRPPAPISIRIYDADIVQLSNLHRQILFTEADIGRPKAEVLAEKLSALSVNQSIEIAAINQRITVSNIETCLADSTLIIDATDSVSTKFLLNDYAVRNRIAYCYGGAVATGGQLLFFDPAAPNSGCLRCMFPDFSENDEACLGPTCLQAGVLGPVVGMIGSLQARVASDYLRGQTKITASGSLFFRIEMSKLHLHESFVGTSPECPVHQNVMNVRRLDLTGKKCPVTFVHTKLALEKVAPNETLEITFSNFDSADSVSRSAREEGHSVLGQPKSAGSDRWIVHVTPKGRSQ